MRGTGGHCVCKAHRTVARRSAHPDHGSEAPAEEFRVKGAFLLNFAKFVEWPPQAFKKPGGPDCDLYPGSEPVYPSTGSGGAATRGGEPRGRCKANPGRTDWPASATSSSSASPRESMCGPCLTRTEGKRSYRRGIRGFRRQRRRHRVQRGRKQSQDGNQRRGRQAGRTAYQRQTTESGAVRQEVRPVRR